MTKLQMIAAIGQALGWTEIWDGDTGHLINGEVTGFHPSDKIRQFRVALPNFPEDLNACAEMRKALNANQETFFIDELRLKVAIGLSWKGAAYALVCAKPEQLCEAFIRAKGLWEGTPTIKSTQPAEDWRDSH